MSYIGNQPTSTAYLTDSFNGDGTTTAFLLSASPANPASILVFVFGVGQDPTTYSITGNTLNFSGAPPAGTANISVRYLGIPASGVTTTAYRTLTEFTATAGQTTFTPPSYTVGFISVFRNGVRLGSADFTATNGTSVVLASGATAGDLVVTESFYVSSVLNAIPNTANAVNQLLISDGAISQSKLATGVGSIGPAFKAYKSSSSQSISNASATKVLYETESFDTNGCFTSSRFTPTVAGYYQLTAGAQFEGFSGSSSYQGIYYIYKNGSAVTFSNISPSPTQYPFIQTNDIQYANGTTDYFEMYFYQNSGGSKVIYGDTNMPTYTWFAGAMVRAA